MGFPRGHQFDNLGKHVFALAPFQGQRKLGQEQTQLLESAADHLGFSPRACHRILKVARTIADLGNHRDIEQPDLAEAIGFRRLAGRGTGA